ncbi:DUF6118 family protein [Phenylobacterium sp.]|uniref:DUF6118 family protein n=1 Tax=Phenylobacterium sp. TaxID=1871053 RepID=UPI0025FF5E7E|nr:DUF6118 family protein [Phenylobacterium sp.]
MSLQPSDPAADAFERLRSEVALLRRAVEGLAAGAQDAPVDYSPTLAELSEAIAAVNAQAVALGERPVLALAPDQLGSLFQIAAAKVLAKPVAELERERTTLRQAGEALRAAREADLAKSRSWRRTTSLLGGGALVGVVLWSLLLGPVARMLPGSWGAPERLASATLNLPMAPAGERLLRRGDPQGWTAVEVARQVPHDELLALHDCMSRLRKTCTVKVGRQ